MAAGAMRFEYPPPALGDNLVVSASNSRGFISRPRPASVYEKPFGTNPTTSLCFAQRLRDISTTFQSFVDGHDELTASLPLACGNILDAPGHPAHKHDSYSCRRIAVSGPNAGPGHLV